MRHLLAAGFLGAVLLVPARATIAAEIKTLQVGTVDNYLPCSDLTENSYEGLSIDLWRAIAEKNSLSYKLSIIPTFGQAVDDAAIGKYDLIASCHKITAGRLRKVSFSVPYTYGTFGFLSKSEKNPLFVVDLVSKSEILLSVFILIVICITGALVISRHELAQCLDSRVSGKLFLAGITNNFTHFLVGAFAPLLKDRRNSNWIVLAIAFARLFLVSLLLGSSASLILERELPQDALSLNDESLKGIVYGGIAVNRATKMDDWLQKKIENIKNIDTSRVKILRATNGEPELVEALTTGKVRHILSDVAVLNRILLNIDDSDSYTISVKNPNNTPQAFVFGSGLDENHKNIINVSIAEFIRSGKSRRLNTRWNKLID
jgi:ABC-type amino acid transport substrate-binding protein